MFKDLHKLASQKFKASGDDVPIADWITEHTTLARKPFSFKRYPFQEQIANDMHPNLSVIKCSQVGLATCINTYISTTYGWTTMGDLKIGDQIFDEKGKICTVTYKSPIWKNRDCYEITFDDGIKIISDGCHRWKVNCYRAFHSERGVDQVESRKGRLRIEDQKNYQRSGIVSTEVMFKKFKLGERNLYSIENTKPINLPKIDLPIDPWLLGVLLGDGCIQTSCITCSHEDKAEMVRQLNLREIKHSIRNNTPDKAVSIGLLGLNPILKSLNLSGKGNKRIPLRYMRASHEQRLELLRGLLDTDGSITKTGRVSFHNTQPELVEGVVELMTMLGYKPRTRWREPNKPIVLKDGRTITGKLPIAEVSAVIYDDTPVFTLPRKFSRQRSRANSRSNESFRRYITNIQKIESVPTQCITVDSPNHLFLCSKGMIPTHNTEVQVRKFFAFLRRMNGTSGIFTLPTEDMARRVYTTRMSSMLKVDDVFNPPSVDKPVRRQDLVQIADSWGYITPCIEGPATSIPADILFHDELDLSDEAMVGLFQSRLQNSEYKITQAFSTPTYLGYGIDKNFNLTDQFHYMMKCGSCNHYQFPEFEQDWIHIPDLNFDIDKLTDMTSEQITGLKLKDAYVKCHKCGSRLDLGNSKLREWVPKFPSKDQFRGYRVNPFSTDRISLPYIFQQLAKYKLNENEKGFHNTVLGRPYSPASAQIPEDSIKLAMLTHGRPLDIGKEKAVFMGIDMGAICHITLVGEYTDGKDPWILFKTCHVSQLSATISELQKEYNIVQACADRYPYTPEVDQLRENTNGMLMPVAYKGNAILAPRKDEAENLIYYDANRTFALDMVRTSIVNNVAVIGGYGSHKDVLIAHLRDMVREESPEKEPRWVKLNGNDHFFHSMAYALLARRVCEHLFLHNLSDTAMTLSIAGMNVGSNLNDPTNRFISKGVKNYGFIG